LIKFYLANAFHKIDFSALGYQFSKQVKLALRVIPVLEPTDALEFLRLIRVSLERNSILILSYALPQGDTYELNKKRANSAKYPGHSEETFAGGIIFRANFQHIDILPEYLEKVTEHTQVLNTYYTKAGFEKLALACGFAVLETITLDRNADNFRVVAALTPS
jgi:hypothetical protein